MPLSRPEAQSVTCGVELHRKVRPRNTLGVTAPDHSPTDPCNRPLRSKFMTWQGFFALPRQRLEHRSRWRIEVCYPGSSNPRVPIYHVHGLIILWSLLCCYPQIFAT